MTFAIAHDDMPDNQLVGRYLVLSVFVGGFYERHESIPLPLGVFSASACEDEDPQLSLIHQEHFENSIGDKKGQSADGPKIRC